MSKVEFLALIFALIITSPAIALWILLVIGVIDVLCEIIEDWLYGTFR